MKINIDKLYNIPLVAVIIVCTILIGMSVWQTTEDKAERVKRFQLLKDNQTQILQEIEKLNRHLNIPK